jgi:hypothetical protein
MLARGVHYLLDHELAAAIAVTCLVIPVSTFSSSAALLTPNLQ